jgi:pantothenate kinase
MSEDMPWVIGLTDEEVQELRKNKQELTQYGKEKIRELMNEEIQLTEKEEKVLDIARNLMEEHKEAFQHLAAIERKEFAEKDFEDLTREQRIQLALEEIDWIVIGGQDGEEFYGSIQFLRKVLRSLV